MMKIVTLLMKIGEALRYSSQEKKCEFTIGILCDEIG